MTAAADQPDLPRTIRVVAKITDAYRVPSILGDTAAPDAHHPKAEKAETDEASPNEVFAEPSAQRHATAAERAKSDIESLLGCDPTKQAAFVPSVETFDYRYHAYVAALTAQCDPVRPDSDEEGNLRDTKAQLAEAILLATPAALPHQAWQKFKILEDAIEDSLRHGPNSGPRLLMALASFKRDLIGFDFGDGPVMHSVA